MTNTTTCTRCGACYEAGSDEQANEPGRVCRTCWAHEQIEIGLRALYRQGETVEVEYRGGGQYDIVSRLRTHPEVLPASHTKPRFERAWGQEAKDGWTITTALLRAIIGTAVMSGLVTHGEIGEEEAEAILLATERVGCERPLRSNRIIIDLGAKP